MRVCNNCSKDMADNAKFCSACGVQYQEVLVVAQEKIEAVDMATELCNKCGAKLKDGALFCTNCGNSRNSEGKNQIKNQRKRQSGAKKKYILSAIALLLVVTVSFYFLNARGGPAYKLKESGTAAFSISPALGLTISAAKNALDKDRSFTATRLSDDQVARAKQSTNRLPGVVPLAGYEIDAGLDPKAMFPGQINMSMDLKELAIDKALYRYLTAVRIGSDGYAEFLDNKVVGDKIEVKSRKNSITLICLLIGLGGAIAGGASHLNNEVNEEFLSGFPQYKDRKIVYSENLNGYIFFWPADLPPSDPEQVNRVESILEGALKKQGYSSKEEFGKDLENYRNSVDANERVLAILKDNDFIEADKLLKDKDFFINKLCPVKVRMAMSTVFLADSYLFDDSKRGFRKQATTYIGLLDNWPYPSDILGVSVNPKLGSPYVHISLNAFPNSATPLKSLAGDEKTNYEEALLTITHELFHVAQAQYVTYDAFSYLWLWESTADLLQMEAAEYYKAKGDLEKADIPLEATKNIFLLKYTMSKAPSEFIQNQGYGSSLFLQKLRDKYYGGNKDGFLKTALEGFSSSKAKSDGLFFIQDITSIKDEVFAKEFEEFVIEHLNDLIDPGKPLTTVLSNANPIALLDTPCGYISSYITNIAFPNPDMNKLVLRFNNRAIKRANEKFTKFLLPKTPKNYDGTEIMLADLELKGEFYDYEVASNNMGATPLNNGKTLLLQTIHGYSSNESDWDGMIVKAFILSKPEMPTAENKGNKIVITLPAQTALELPDSGGKKIVESYIACITDTEGNKAFAEIPFTEGTFEVPLLEGNKKIDLEKLENQNTKIVNQYKSTDKAKEDMASKDAFSIKLIRVTNSEHSIFSDPSDKLTVEGAEFSMYELEGEWANGSVEVTEANISDSYGAGMVGNKATMKVSVKAKSTTEGVLTLTRDYPLVFEIKLEGAKIISECFDDSNNRYVINGEIKKSNNTYSYSGKLTVYNKESTENVVAKFYTDK